MAHSVVHFAVYVDDADRAMAFYEGVFGWRFEAWGPPGYWMINAGTDGDPGLRIGALSQRTRPRGEGAPNAYRCTVTVRNLDDACADIKRHGGTIHSAAAEIPTVGKVVEFIDTEGNLACVMQYVDGHPLAAR